MYTINTHWFLGRLSLLVFLFNDHYVNNATVSWVGLWMVRTYGKRQYKKKKEHRIVKKLKSEKNIMWSCCGIIYLECLWASLSHLYSHTPNYERSQGNKSDWNILMQKYLQIIFHFQKNLLSLSLESAIKKALFFFKVPCRSV